MNIELFNKYCDIQRVFCGVRMALRRTLSLFNRVNGGPTCANNNNARLLNSATLCGTSSYNSSSFRNWAGITVLSNSCSIDRRMLSTKHKPKSSPELPTVNMGSILEHHKYKEMKSRLSRRNKKSLGPLDTASLYILSSKDLTINLEILRLDALSLRSHLTSGNKGHAEIKEMKQSGAVKQGKLNKEDEVAIEKRFETLLAETGLHKEALMKELFAANKGSPFNWDEDFMFKRQLAGFYLSQGMKDGDRRLPMEVYSKLAVLLFSGSFTKEEDVTILAWVDKHGATRWAELARILRRSYANAGATIRCRYEELAGKAKGNRQGAYDSEELSVLIKEVMKKDPAAFEKPMEDSDLDVKRIASCMGRSLNGLCAMYTCRVHPTVRRHKLGTLEKDVRGELIQQVKENGWDLSADIEYDKLARLPQFKGHSNGSLHDKYTGMLGNAMNKLGKKSRREVTVEEVEEWWKNSTRYAKQSNVIEKEQQIVEAYYSIKQEIGIGNM